MKLNKMMKDISTCDINIETYTAKRTVLLRELNEALSRVGYEVVELKERADTCENVDTTTSEELQVGDIVKFVGEKADHLCCPFKLDQELYIVDFDLPTGNLLLSPVNDDTDYVYEVRREDCEFVRRPVK